MPRVAPPDGLKHRVANAQQPAVCERDKRGVPQYRLYHPARRATTLQQGGEGLTDLPQTNMRGASVVMSQVQ